MCKNSGKHGHREVNLLDIKNKNNENPASMDNGKNAERRSTRQLIVG